MNFKRKFFGYHRKQVEEMLAQRIQDNNEVLKAEEEFLKTLEEEGRQLDDELRLITGHLEQAQARERQIESCHATLEVIFDLLSRDTQIQSGRMLASAKQLAEDIRDRQQSLLEAAATLDSSIAMIHGQIVNRMEFSQEQLSEQLRQLDRLNMRYSSVDQMITAEPGFTNSSEDRWPIINLEADKRGLQVVKNMKNTEPSTPTAESIPSRQDLRALVIDDDPIILGMLRSVFEREGYTVTEARDGQMASDIIDMIEPPTVVILDIMLPYLDGVQLIRKIRSLEAWNKTPVIMLTGKSSDQEKVKLLEAGANDYMVKPFNIKELMTRVKKVVNRSSEAI